MITHFTITPQCIDCDNDADTVTTLGHEFLHVAIGEYHQ